MSVWDTLLGLLLAFFLFLATQLWRERRQRNAFREALLAQLRALEAELSATVVSLSYGLEDPSTGVREFRWYLSEGRRRIDPSPLPDVLEKIKDGSDVEIREYLKNHQRGPDRLLQSPPIRTAVLQGLLTGQGSGFSMSEMELLSDLAGQIALLQTHRDQIIYYHQLTFSATHESDHQKIREWINRLEEGYLERLEAILDHYRRTLAKLERPPR
ncbi:MAG: hypothetical protein GTO40_00180 [Deltaproteobacteria bacterium]|nr:hypothetical protein [Deltaproteobacteria bacterium]